MISTRTLVFLLLTITLAGCTSTPENNNKTVQIDPNQRDTQGRTPLMQAVQKGDPAAVQAAIDSGGNVNAKTDVGVTPLIMAAGMEKPEVVKMLITKGADVNAMTPGNFTALMSAALNGQAENVKILLDAGANPTIRDNGGRSAADYAKDKKHDDIVALLNPKPAQPANRGKPTEEEKKSSDVPEGKK